MIDNLKARDPDRGPNYIPASTCSKEYKETVHVGLPR
jgi:hypothetical protein